MQTNIKFKYMNTESYKGGIEKLVKFKMFLRKSKIPHAESAALQVSQGIAKLYTPWLLKN